MEEKNIENNVYKKPFPFFTLLFKKLFLIIIITVLFGGAGFAYSKWRNNTEYTATVKLMFKVDASQTNISNGDKVTLATTFLPMTSSIIKSPIEVEQTNAIYKGKGGIGSVGSGAISVNYGESSLIFSISYVDSERQKSIDKLNAIIENAENRLSGYFPSEEVALIKVQNTPEIIVTTGMTKYVLIGAGAGFVLICAIILLRYALDNTVNDKDEIEKLTGTNVIAYIEDVKIPKQNNKKKKK